MFISVEGVEGCGKTTILKMIYDKLLEENYEILLLREPGGVKISEKIRNIILDKENTNLDNKAEALLFAASRRQLVIEKILPALKENKIILCDRYVDSSLAYQGGGKGLGVENILNINMFATDNVLPDMTILFDIEPELGLKRIETNSAREVNRLDLEKIEFYKKVRETFLDLAKKYSDRYVIIDASLPLNEVFETTYKIIKDKIDGNK